jgi:hypothetical protein
MSDSNDNQTRNQPDNQDQTQNQNQLDLTEPPDKSSLVADIPESPGNEETHGRYSYLGPQGDDTDDEANTDPDNYGPQDQFGDLDNQDPYSNLYDEDAENEMNAASDGPDDPEAGLYGLAEPLAQPGDESRKGRDKDRYGTRGSQDQYGYQQ